MPYIWESLGWPALHWDSGVLLPLIGEARGRLGEFLGRMKDIGFDARLQSELEATAEEVVKTSAIEREVLNPASVRSSIARRLGLEEGGVSLSDRKVDGVVDLILDATKNHARPLTKGRIFAWHAALFPTGFSGMTKIDIGQWRSDRAGPMQVISGPYAHEPRVHFQAPPADRLEGEMDHFIRWFNGSQSTMEPLLRAGLAHLWFVTIHPMDDGNGRIARAIADLAVAQLEGTGQRFYSMSSQIERDKKTYYEVLEATQKGGLDVTIWMTWFVESYSHAIENAAETADKVVSRAKFWHANADFAFSERQRKVLLMLLDGFDGFVTSDKWAKICNCSSDSAQRDIANLAARGILLKNPGGSRKTSYRFNWPPEP